MHKKFLSTTEIAAMLEVNRYTVSLWIDRGVMKAMITPGGHKKVPREEVVRFMQSRGMNMPPELGLVQRKRLVIVDDESSVAQTIKNGICMVFPDLDVDIYTHPVTALLNIGKNPPDLVLLDIVMPDMNGISVCGKIREDKTTKKVRIIAMSGLADKTTIAHCCQAGAEEFFYKTDPLPKLFEMISKISGIEPLKKVLERWGRVG